MKQESSWNKVYKNFPGGRLSVWSESATPFFTRRFGFLKREKVKRVLDAGCGDGRNLLALAKAGFDATGVDSSEAALKLCRKNMKDLGNVKTAVRTGRDLSQPPIIKKARLEKLPIKKNSFDAIICDHTLVHVRKIEKVLAELGRILKPEGYFFLEFTSTQDPLFGKGKRISEFEYMNNGVYLRFFNPDIIKALMANYKLITLKHVRSTHPEHGAGYIRKKRHTHWSWFGIWKK